MSNLTNQLRRGYHFLQALAANLIYGFPSRGLTVIAVTGTKGKTTTAHLIAAVLERAGYTVGLSSTVAFKVGRDYRVNETNKTVVDPFRLQRFAKELKRAGCQYWVCEVSSHGIDQYRIWGIPIAVSVFTSLSHDHLDYHASFAEYRSVKQRLFRMKSVHTVVVNRDDEHWKEFYRFSKPTRLLYGTELHRSDPPSPDVVARKILLAAEGTTFTVVTPQEQSVVRLKLPGLFNVSNALAAISVGISLGIRLTTVVEAVESVSLVPGRMERVVAGQPFEVIVDYAHTPDSFEQVLRATRSITKGKLIHVFGATGDRDRTKRPIMGAISARLSDLSIVTDEEPYTEDPALIRAAVLEGVRRGRPAKDSDQSWCEEIPDRKAAIARALRLASKGDVVLITGMGALTSRTIGVEHQPWQERKVVEELLQSNRGKNGA